MVSETVQCARRLEASADAVWALLGTFDVSWHPDVETCTLFRSEDGAIRRVLTTVDGGEQVEQRTYLSDTKRVLCYIALSGLDAVSSYAARVEVIPLGDGCEVTWQAEIKAYAQRGKQVAEGTRAIFEAGLDALQAAAPPLAKARLAQDGPRSRVTNGTLDGVPSLTYLKGATGGETLVLFLHGIGGQASNWTPQIASLGDDYAVAALNLRGYGGSTLGTAQTQVDDCCDDILALKSHLQAKRLVLVGLSYGSWIATSFAMRHPEALSGLVLAGGCTGMSEAGADERESFRKSREVPLDQGQTPADFAADVVSAIAGPAATQSVRWDLTQSMAMVPPETYRDALNCFTNPRERFDFAKITCPVLMMTGEHDRLAPPAEISGVSERIFERGMAVRGAADVRFEVLPEAGHVCNLEQPRAFNQLLRQFLRRLPGVAQGDRPNREEKRQAKHRRILMAAHDEFCRAGFDGASMDRLAKAADVSKPTLYQYFGDKEGLFSKVLDAGRKHIVAPLLDPEATLVERLWTFSWTYAEFVLRPDMLSLARLILGEANRRPHSAKQYHQEGPERALAGLIDFIEHCVADGELSVKEPHLAANDLWSLTLSGPRDYFLHNVSERPTQSDLLKSIEHGLRVFLKVYSTLPEEDLEALSIKVQQMQNDIRMGQS